MDQGNTCRVLNRLAVAFVGLNNETYVRVEVSVKNENDNKIKLGTCYWWASNPEDSLNFIAGHGEFDSPELEPGEMARYVSVVNACGFIPDRLLNISTRIMEVV